MSNVESTSDEYKLTNKKEFGGGDSGSRRKRERLIEQRKNTAGQ